MRPVSRLVVGGALLRHEQHQTLPQERRDQRPAQLPAHAGEVAAVLTADEDERAARSQGSPQPPHRGASADVEDQVVAASPVGEVLAGVVDDVVGAQRGHQVDLRGAAHAGDLGAERLRQLDRVGADAAGRADHQHGLTGLHAPGVDERLQRGAGRDGNDRGLGEGQVRGLAGELVLPRHGVLGERPGRHAVHLVADREPRHRRPHLPPPCRPRRARGPGSSVCAARRPAASRRACRSSGARCRGRARPRARCTSTSSSPIAGRATRAGRRTSELP